MESSTKKWYLSKTLWSNLILGVLALAVPWVRDNVTQDTLVSVFAGINIVLRLITKDKLTLKE